MDLNCMYYMVFQLVNLLSKKLLYMYVQQKVFTQSSSHLNTYTRVSPASPPIKNDEPKKKASNKSSTCFYCAYTKYPYKNKYKHIYICTQYIVILPFILFVSIPLPCIFLYRITHTVYLRYKPLSFCIIYFAHAFCIRFFFSVCVCIRTRSQRAALSPFHRTQIIQLVCACVCTYAVVVKCLYAFHLIPASQLTSSSQYYEEENQIYRTLRSLVKCGEIHYGTEIVMIK